MGVVDLAKKPIIYFLCTGNSCRSQMAEGFGKQLLGNRFDVHSAGIEAHGVNPFAVQIMEEVGVDISTQTSNVINSDLLNRAAYAITLCGNANERCPITPPGVRRFHWDLDDPAKAERSEEERLKVFRRVRDEIRGRIQAFRSPL